MAFWGIELKPGKPYTHEYDEAHGRLHISQAVLGSGSGTEKCIVSCGVGKRNPVFICSLLPDKTESCPVDLEFEEEDEVIFSVDGPRSVHLSGYYLGPTGGFDHEDDDADSYGEDLSEAESEESTDYDNEDEYDVDFADDSDLEIFQSSAQPTSGVRIEEIVDDEKAEHDISTKYAKKVNQLSEPAEEDDDDDDDGSQHQIVVRGIGGQVIESEDEDEDGFPLPLTSKSKATSMNVNASKNSNTEETAASKKKEKEKKKKKKKQEDSSDQVTCLKRKIDAIGDDGELESGPKELSHHPEASGGATAEEGGKPKKKKEKVEKKVTEINGSNLETSKTVGDENRVIDDKKLVASHDEKLQLGDVTMDRMDHDAAVVDNQEEGLPDDENAAANAATNEISAKKKKKKNRKSKGPQNDATGAIGQEAEPYKSMTNVEENDKVEAQSSKIRTFSNGLVIEELSMGKPDGKRASPGNRASVHYIGRLKKNGQIFDSNIGKRPFRFRLGIGQVIKGWDVGVAGMRIGDKRRLTIPPSMGYGIRGAGNKIPPNSWLVFDVELVEVM